MLKLSMDTKDMLEYRKVLQQKCDKSLKTSGPQDSKYLRLQKQLDIMDMVFDTIFVATMNEVAPQFAALTGGDFDMPSLKLAIGEFSSADVKEDTQVALDFKAAAEDVEPIIEEVPVIVPEVSKPAEDMADYVEEIRKMLSRSFAKNIEPAIELYLKGTGKKILPADAWTEIKDMLTGNKLIKGWDIYIANQFRMINPLAAFLSIKKWVPTWDDVEIGRIAEDALKRVLGDTEHNTPSVLRQLEMMIETEPTKDQKDLWINNPQNQNALGLMLRIEHNQVVPKSVAEKETAAKIALVEKKALEKAAKRMIACMNPVVRRDMEKSYGRKPYVEKGYPEA